MSINVNDNCLVLTVEDDVFDQQIQAHLVACSQCVGECFHDGFTVALFDQQCKGKYENVVVLRVTNGELQGFSVP